MKRLPILLLGTSSIALLAVHSATGFECGDGEKVTAGLGEGVTLHSCSFKKSPGQFVRAGPLELVRNGILILKLETDRSGKLQGNFNSWDDRGVILESGYYVNGLKHGEWRITDNSGERVTLQFRAGIPVAL
jgi:hypothetical protein